jgi:hypothetical protein
LYVRKDLKKMYKITTTIKDDTHLF